MKKHAFFILIITLSYILRLYTQNLPPKQFKLYQNAPDPFDTTGTFIRFDLPESVYVYLLIGDINGYLITSLTSEQFPIGEHQIYWNAKGQDSTYIIPGTYTCKMSAIKQNQLAVSFRDSIHMHFQMITGVRENTSGAYPLKFRLNQNYPNPFNPSTKIEYQIPLREGFVSLKVYDLLGREVATLVNEQKPAGTYTQQWNATSLPSGVYFYRLQAGAFTETKKLILLR
jgi:flagellar hook assembly protein FlgD